MRDGVLSTEALCFFFSFREIGENAQLLLLLLPFACMDGRAVFGSQMRWVLGAWEKIRCFAWLGCCISLVGMGALDARKEGFLEMGNYFFNLRDEWRGGGEGTGGYFV